MMLSFWGWTSLVKCVPALWLAHTLLIVANAQLDEEQLFYLRLRPRLGHFVDVEGYLNIFENYFETIKVNDVQLTKLDINDWRNVRPTGELCLDFLQSFQIKKYKLAKPHTIIALDACLGWLFDESDEKAEDYNRFNPASKVEIDKLAKDTKLATIYQSTAFKDDTVPQKTKDELYEYLLKLIKVYADNPRNGCHGLWLETYTDFIEDVYLADCDKDDECVYYGYEEASKDSYLSLVAESTKQSSITCYGVMQKQIKRIMRQAYDEEMAVSAKLSKKIKQAMTKVDQQSEAMMWGKDMTKILQLVSGTDPDTPINLVQVVQDLNKLRINDEDTVERFTEAVGKYAIQNVNLKDSANDPEGRARFGKAVTKLCKAYINPQLFLAQTGGSTLWQDTTDTKKPFEFYNIVYGLIRLTNHLPIYGISKDKFEEDVLKNKWESLYLTTFACQLISVTWGELNYDTNEEAYSVSFRVNDGEDLIEDWPLHVMLAKIIETAPAQVEAAPAQQPHQQQQQAAQEVAQRAQTTAPVAQQQQQQQQQQQAQPQLPPSSPGRDDHSAGGDASGGKKHSLFKLKLFSKSSNNKSNQVASSPQAAAPVVTEAPKPDIKVPSLANIELFRDLHGRYPELPPNIHEIYPSLPKNLDGVYPKRFGVAKPKPAPQQQSRPADSYSSYNSYNQRNAIGGNSYDEPPRSRNDYDWAPRSASRGGGNDFGYNSKPVGQTSEQPAPRKMTFAF